MTQTKLSDAEKLVRMIEWNTNEPWECGAEGDEEPGGDHLARAKRFLAAQSFLLSWQEGKVPTGWRRPRTLGDLSGQYPSSLIDEAEDIIAARIEERNLQRTAKLNNMITARGKAPSLSERQKSKDVEDKKMQVIKLKKEFKTFSDEFFAVKNALSKATTAVADVSFRVQAISEVVKQRS